MTAARIVVGAAALCLLVAGLRWGTWSAGGADSYGYVSQSSLWIGGSLVVDQPIAREAPWRGAASTFTPLGYRPGLEKGTIVPVYPSGLPLAMAVLQVFGGRWAVYLVVPLLGALAVVCAAMLAWRLGSPAAGAAAALILASRSIVIYAVMWPMSDVPAAAWWALATALAPGAGVTSAIGSGAAAAMAILTRPNLAGVALAPALYLVARVWQADARRRTEWHRLFVFGACVALGAMAVAAIHTGLYGGPFETGYGTLTRVYSTEHPPDATTGLLSHPLKFDVALLSLALIGAAAGLRAGGRPGARAVTGLAIAVVALVLVSHMLYPASPDWWYLRFLLTAYPPLAALGRRGPRLSLWFARAALARGGVRRAPVRAGDTRCITRGGMACVRSTGHRIALRRSGTVCC